MNGLSTRQLHIIVANPAGNVTAFVLDPVDRSDYARAASRIFALPDYGVEQVGFIKDGRTMEMSGLEFCGNATRAFGLYMAKNGGDIGLTEDGDFAINVNVSGASTPLRVEGNVNTDNARVFVELPAEILSIDDYIEQRELHDERDWLNGGTIVNYEGIVHAVVPAEIAKVAGASTVGVASAAKEASANSVSAMNEASASNVGTVKGNSADTEITTKVASAGTGSTMQEVPLVEETLNSIELDNTASYRQWFDRFREHIYSRYSPEALGVVFCEGGDSVTPVVYVRDVDTVYFEGSCGSGTTAYAVAQSIGKPDGIYEYDVEQPAGCIHATCKIEKGNVAELSIESAVEFSDVITLAVDF